MTGRDPDRVLTREEIDRITGGGILRAIPLVKLWDMLRGRSRPVQARRPTGRDGRSDNG